MTKWKIYYSDGSTYTDEDGSVFDAPGRGVLSIGQTHAEVGREYLAKADFYWWHEEMQKWVGGEQFGFYDYLVEPGPKKVIFGRTVPTRSFNHVLQGMFQDSYLPPKSARLPGEITCQS